MIGSKPQKKKKSKMLEGYSTANGKVGRCNKSHCFEGKGAAPNGSSSSGCEGGGGCGGD